MDNMSFTLLEAPRGIRNNNPGNIIKGKTLWRGMAQDQDDPRFVVFSAPVWGLRALMKTLLTYYRRHGLDTVHSIVNRWAPPHENATDHYAEHVALKLKVHRTALLRVDDPAILVKLAQAIVLHENGKPVKSRGKFWYPQRLYEEAAIMALKKEENI